MGASVGEGVRVAGCGLLLEESSLGLQPATNNKIQKIQIIFSIFSLGSTAKIITD